MHDDRIKNLNNINNSFYFATLKDNFYYEDF
jgi:hypothetical protein